MKAILPKSLHNFQTNSCPICNQVLKASCTFGVTIYSCPETVELQTSRGIQTQSHYEVECDAKNTIQHIYTLPFCVDNFSNQNKSRVFKLDPTSARPWKLLADVPFLNPSEIHIMMNRLHAFFPNDL